MNKVVTGLQEYYGIFFDPATGKTYREDGTDTGFTFERAKSGSGIFEVTWPWLNPLQFATQETALKIMHFLRGICPESVRLTLDETNRFTGLFNRTIERGIVVESQGREETFNAGLLANSIIRNGEQGATTHFLAELRLAGFRV